MYYSGNVWTTTAFVEDTNITPKIGSNYIYATTEPDSGILRVGYECTNGRLCEASYVNDAWQKREF